MKNVINFIPNALTLLNAFMGFMAIVFIGKEEMVYAVVCVGIALILDFLDGLIARLLNAQSELGQQLDSLADAITFGLVPGMILFQMIVITQGYYFIDISKWPMSVFLNASIAGLVPLGAIYRLGVFNLKEGSGPHFHGLPTPAMSMFVLSIPLVLESNYHLNFYHPLSDNFIEVLGETRKWDASDIGIVKMMYSPLTYQITSVVLMLLMVSRIPMLSLKFKGINWKRNKWHYAILIWVLVAYFIFLIPYVWELPFNYGLIDYLILPIFMIGYFILSLIYATFGISKETVKTDEI